VPLLLAAQTPPPAASAIGIRLVEGDGAINSIRLHRGHDPVVQVLNRTNQPVEGATVTFLLPASGPSASFGDSGLSLTVQTDAKGMADARGLRPNRVEGQFRIRVTASWHGEAATASVMETNAEPSVKSGSSKTIIILAIVGAVAAGGAVAATHGGKSASSTIQGVPASSPAAATIVAGSPSFGPPH
jgi:hypothetical protein